LAGVGIRFFSIYSIGKRYSKEDTTLIDRIDALIRFFLYVLIFWLPYSPAVIESCVIICLILWLLKRGIILTKEKGSARILKDVKPESTFLNKPIAFFLLACLLSVTGSAFFGQSLHNFFTKTLEWFIVYFLVVEVFKDKKHITIVLAIFIFTAFSTAIDSLIQFYITHKDIFLGVVIEPGARATAAFKTSNGLGGYLTLIIPMLLAWIFLSQQKLRYRLIILSVFLFLAWSLVVTFSRGAWIGVFFGGMFLLLFVLIPKKRLQFYFSFSFLGAATVLLISFILILANGSDQQLFNRIETIQWRLGIWSISMEVIKDKFLFGHGINTFMRVFQEYRGNNMMGPTYAHNCYIQLAAEVGIVGLLCFFWIIAEVFHQSLGRIKIYFTQDRNLAAVIIGLLSGIFAFLVHSFFDTHFYSLQLSVYLWFMIGILVAVCQIFDNTARARHAASPTKL